MSNEKNNFAKKVDTLEKKMGAQEEEIAYKETKFSKTINTVKDDATQSYIVGFEAAMEQVALLHPSVDFSEFSPCKSVVNGKLFGEP